MITHFLFGTVSKLLFCFSIYCILKYSFLLFFFLGVIGLNYFFVIDLGFI